MWSLIWQSYIIYPNEFKDTQQYNIGGIVTIKIARIKIARIKIEK